MARAVAFVVVTPEYNHSLPASLKQAIDVAYGCRSVGLHAVDQLRTAFTAPHGMTVEPPTERGSDHE
ncbi:NAD(P)H-dependent oxidoreductase [Micromonospora sp. WMMD998]|uniref:NAD(P)H-dependent oxidoreductase n=1 Tax=Micromonospora sp. WMMD998 TaxID=3016092 RepID=UPI00249BF886|nr:NAD(P)H-dependent oxidoreductase [Micromonospora sp. WMMD998]WFE38652.1 NAD(P)H-dependent oxidoreductase [Micromonospora sp. WMMD998]